MNSIITVKRILIGGAASALIAVSPGIVMAHGTSGSNGQGGGAKQTAARHDDQNNQHNGDTTHPKLTCDQRQEAINQKTAEAKARYTKQLTGLNIVFSGTQTYVSSGNVTVENYDSLSAKVTADQTAATNAVNAITAPDLNCDDTTQSTTSMNDKNKDGQHGLDDSVKAARQALDTYHHDVMKLFAATLDS